MPSDAAVHADATAAAPANATAAPAAPAAPATITITRRCALSTADVDSALALSDAAGWNQTADDWAHFARAGGAIGERAADGRLVATAATLRQGRFGWISMVLVAADHRHRGLASRLVDASLASLRAQGCIPALDATPDGRAVYRALGFVDGFVFERWERAGAPVPSDGAAATVAGAPDPIDADALAALDRAASGLDRPAWFADVAARPCTRAVVAADGFALVRAGRRALQLGPVVAPDEAAAIDLVERALAAVPGERVFVDVPVARTRLLDRLAVAGFVRQRPFTRMAQGSAPPPLGARQFAFAGPEFG